MSSTETGYCAAVVSDAIEAVGISGVNSQPPPTTMILGAGIFAILYGKREGRFGEAQWAMQKESAREEDI